MKSNFKRLFEKICFPFDACCVLCESEYVYASGLCKKCYESLEKLEGERCEICLDRINTKGLCKACLEKRPDYERLCSAYSFSGNMRKLIHSFKFGNARYLAHVLCDFAEIPECDIIVPVPLSSERLKERKYNQAELLAREFGFRNGVPVVCDVLKKKDGGKQMALLDKKERRKNIKGLYFCEKKLNGETVLLVDDVCTTGETLRACAHQLKRAGAGKIYCTCIARTEIKK